MLKSVLLIHKHSMSGELVSNLICYTSKGSSLLSVGNIICSTMLVLFMQSRVSFFQTTLLDYDKVAW